MHPSPRDAIVLLIEDDPEARATFADLVDGLACQCLAAGSGSEAHQLLAKTPPPAVIAADLHLPDTNGLALMRGLHPRLPATRTLLFTGAPHIPSVLHALEEGFLDRFATKPVAPDRFISAIRALLRMRKTNVPG